MATKLYLPSGAGSGLPTISGSTPTWNNTGAVESAQRMSTVKSNSTMTTTGNKYGDATSGFRTHLIKRFISRPVTAQTISGDVQLQLRCAESSTSLNATLAIAVYRINSSGAYQDTLLSVSYSDNSSSPYEMATSLTNRRAHDINEDYTIPLTSRTFSAGDMIVVEIGFAESNTSTTRYATFSFGDDSSTDLGDNTTDTSAYNPWVNFSQTITFQTTYVNATTKCRNLIANKNIANGGESGTATGLTKYYTNGSPTISADGSNAYAGSYGIKLNNNGDADGGGLRLDDNNLVPVTVGTNYVTSFYNKNPNADGWIAIIWYNSSKTELSYSNSSWTSSATYQRRQISQAAPTNAAYASFYYDNGSLTVDGWIDNIQLEEGTTATDYIEPGLPGGVLSGSATGTVVKIITATASGGATLSSTTANATKVIKATTFTIGKNKVALNVANGTENGTVDGITDGIYTTVTSSTSNPYSGSRAIRCAFDGTGSSNGWVNFYKDESENKIPVTAGLSYAFQFQNANSTLGQIIGINWYNSSNQYLSYNESNFTGSSGYTKRSVVATAPVNAAYAEPYWQPGVNSAMTVDLDEIMFEQGSSASTFELPGDVSSGGTLLGTAEGTVTGYETVSGTISATSGATGAINVTKNVSGTITPSSTVTGTIRNTRNVTGTISANSGVTGTVNRIFSVSGTIGALSGLTGTVIKVTNVSGTIGAISGVTGSPTLTRRVIGSITGISGSSGTAKLLGALQGTISATSSVTGTLTRTRTAQGTITSQSTATGTLNRIRAIAGTITAQSGLTGTAQLIAGFKYAEGLIATTSGVTGTARLFRGVSGTINAQSGVTGSINVVKRVIGTITAQSGVTGTLNNIRKVAGTITTQSNLTGTLNNLRKVTGTITTQSNLTGTLTRTRIVQGTITAQSNLTGAITRIISVSGLISATTTVIGSILKLVGLPDQHATFTLKKNNTTFTLKQNNTSFSIKKLGITIDRKGD